MSTFKFHPPLTLNKSIFGGNLGTENFRAKNLLLLNGFGSVSKGQSSGKKLDYEFIKVPYTTPGKCKIDVLVSKFSSATNADVKKFLDNAKIKNLKYHKKIYYELVNTLGYLQEKNNISCFLHLYRIIEQSALCLPIITIFNKGNLDNSFVEFKKLIEGGARSDLTVLKKYSENQPANSPLETTVRLSFSGTSRPKQNVDVVRRFITNPISTTPDSIDFKYKNVEALIIGFRNQFFHFLFHEKNLALEDIEYPEEFLEVCNPIFINYFSFLFRDLIDTEKSLWG